MKQFPSALVEKIASILNIFMIRNIINSILTVIALLTLPGCDSSDWDDMPEQIQIFVDKYFNDTDIESFSDRNGRYVVVIRNGAAMTFGTDYEWITVDGRGNTLPSVLISDQLPQKLYDYLLNLEAVSHVYVIDRDFRTIRVQLTDTSLSYNRQTEEITYSTSSSDN